MGVWNIGKTWYAYFKYTTRMGYVPPPRRLRYRTNLFVIWVWYKEMMTYCCVTMYLEVPCPVRVEIPKYNCYNRFMWIMWTILSNYSFAYGAAWSYDAGTMRCWLQFLLERDVDVSHLLFGTSEFCYRWARRIFEDWWVEQLRDRFWKDVVCSMPERRWLSFEPW